MISEYELRRELCETCRRIYDRDLIAGAAGNVSVQAGPNRFLLTPAGACKGYLTPQDLVVVDSCGRKIAGSREPSSEFRMHQAIYAARPDVRAVVHAHPVVATAFTLAGRSLDLAPVTEGLQVLGRVATAPYATPGTTDLGHALAELVANHDVVLLAHHGAVTLANSLQAAFQLMETLEHTAKVAWHAAVMGGMLPLPAGETDRLLSLRAKPRASYCRI